MLSCEYIGEIEHLKGKEALLRELGGSLVILQFNDADLTKSGKTLFSEVVLEYEPHARFAVEVKRKPSSPPQDALGYGWHIFDKKDIKYI